MRPNAKQEQRDKEKRELAKLIDEGKLERKPIDALTDFTGYIKSNFPKSISSPFYDINKNKLINVDNAKVNLALFYDIMAKYEFEYRLVFGTLLGIYRDGDLIKHDQDIDIGIRPSQLPVLEKALPELCENGFNVTRYSKNMLVSLSRNDEYIDLYIFNNQSNGTYTCGMYKLWDEDFTSPTELDFMDRRFKTVAKIEPFLVTYYGLSWKTPIKGISANPKNR
jgi:hypothetical protein